MKRFLTLVLLASLALAGCGAAPQKALTPVKLMLDWVPNTNHTGLFVAQAQGYFTQAGLQVEIIQPGEVYAEQAVASGAADFGISFQEQITLARADGVPLVSIAAILQHNTSGFAARGALGAQSPADWEGLRYGAFGSPFEEPTLRVLMECAGGDFSKLQVVDVGFTDPLSLLQAGQIDLAWIFLGWQGQQAAQLGIDLSVTALQDWQRCIPDYYTPVLVASEQTLTGRPEVVRAFLQAASRGYTFAIQNPDQAADLLLKAAPELNADLVRASQTWLSPRYQAEAPRWGEQRLQVWADYADWMVRNGILAAPIDAAAAFTNDLLP